MSESPPYAAVLVHLLDRESGVSKPYMLYPATCIEFHEFTDGNVAKTRTFIAEADGARTRWVEQD